MSFGYGEIRKVKFSISKNYRALISNVTLVVDFLDGRKIVLVSYESPMLVWSGRKVYAMFEEALQRHGYPDLICERPDFEKSW